MRSVRFAWLFVFPFLAVPCWGKQAPQQASAPQPTSDPQAVAVVQAAINALGGATAIGQAQSWTVQGLLDGPIGNGSRSETISWNIPTMAMPGGTTASARRPAIPSAF